MQIRQRLRIDREKAHGRSVFRRHVGDRGAIGNAQAGKPSAVELDEFSDDSFFAQHFGDGQDEIGGRGAFAEFSVQPEANNFRNEHRRRLAKHGGFRFDASDAPAKHAQRIDHGGV